MSFFFRPEIRQCASISANLARSPTGSTSHLRPEAGARHTPPPARGGRATHPTSGPSWARGTEGDTAQTAGSQAYKKRLSFPPVHGFREWSAKQENPPPGSKFQAGSRLLTECRDAIPAEVASDVSRELGDRLYAVYSEAMKIKQRPEKEPVTVDKMFRFEDAWQGSSKPKAGSEVIIDHKRELRRAGPMGKTTGLENKPGGGKAASATGKSGGSTGPPSPRRSARRAGAARARAPARAARPGCGRGCSATGGSAGCSCR